jgi:hypothetical protein
MGDEAYMPGPLDSSLKGEELLDAYVHAEGWYEGSCSAKQDRAWGKRRDELRAMILERLT